MSTRPDAPTAPLSFDVRPPISQPARARTAWPRWPLYGGGGLILLAVLGSIAQPKRWYEGWFGAASAEGPVHVVAPATLSVTLQEEGELKPVNTKDIKVEVQGDGITIQWIVDESTFVKKGDLLVRLASKELADRVEQEELELRSVQAGLEEARQNLEITRSENASKIKKAEIDLEVARLEERKYMSGDYEKSKKQAQINIAQGLLDFNQKCEDLEKNLPLRDKGFVTESKIDELKAAIEKASLTLEMYRLEDEILDKYELPKNKMQKESTVEQSDEELDRERKRAASREQQAIAKVADQEQKLKLRTSRFDRFKEQLAKSEIYAPTDGIVQYGDSGGNWRWGGNRIAVGERVYEGQVLITLPDTSMMMAQVRVHEADRHKIREGLPCLVKVPAVPGVVLNGKISKIAQFADSGRSWWNPELKEHATEIRLDETDAPLSPGDTAQVEILIEEVPNALTVPVQAVFARGAKNFAFVERGGGTPVEIKLGRSSSTMVEVVDGLKAGDKVLLSPHDDLVAKLPSSMEAPGAAVGKKGKIRRVVATQPAATSEPAAGTTSQPADTQPAASQPAEQVAEDSEATSSHG